MAALEAKLQEYDNTFMVGGIVRALHALHGAQVVLDELEVAALAASLAGRSSVEAAELIRLFQEQTGAVWKEDTPGLAYYRFGGDLRTIEADAGLLDQVGNLAPPSPPPLSPPPLPSLSPPPLPSESLPRPQPLRKLLAVALPVSTELFPALVRDMDPDYLNDLIKEWQRLRDAHTGLDQHIRAGGALLEPSRHLAPPLPPPLPLPWLQLRTPRRVPLRRRCLRGRRRWTWRTGPGCTASLPRRGCSARCSQRRAC